MNGGNVIKNIIQKVKDRFTLTGYKNSVKNFLKKYGDLKIKRIMISRISLQKPLQVLLNIFKNPKYKEHDKYFHLFMQVLLSNGMNVRLEKNEDITITITKYQKQKLQENLFIPFNYNEKVFTLNQMLENTRKKVGDQQFFKYNALSDNCQRFVMDVLESNNFQISNTDKQFILQPVKDLIPKWTEKIMQFATDTKSISNKLLGKGLQQNQLKFKLSIY